MENNRKSIWKITVSIFTKSMMLILLSAGASATIFVTKTSPLVQENHQRRKGYPLEVITMITRQ